MGKIISFASTRGGVGKSTITSMVANYIHKKVPGKKVIVVDADDLQNTLFKIRSEEEGLLIQNDPNFDTKKLYEIRTVSSDQIPELEEDLRKKYDYIFIDFPFFKQNGSVTGYSVLDQIFVPVPPSKHDIESALSFANFIMGQIPPGNRKKPAIHGFFNRVNRNNKDFKELYANKDKLDIPFMKNYIPELVMFQRSLSTAGVYNGGKDGEYEDFFNEIMQIIDN